MRYVKSIVPILVQNYYLFGGQCCPNKKNTIEEEKKAEINTSNNEDDKKNLEEEIIKKHQDENLKKIKNFKKPEVTEEDVKNNIDKNIIFEPEKGSKYYDDLIKKLQKDVDENIAIKDDDNIIENNIPNKKEEKDKVVGKSITDVFKEGQKVGLANIGATCYMNATLQCFLHIKSFVDFFRKKDKKNFENKELSKAFKELIDIVWTKDHKLLKKGLGNPYYEPNNFKATISRMSSLFEGIAANDSKDLINFIIMTLHEELNRAKPSIIDYIPTNQTNFTEVFNAFENDFMKNNKSIMSDLFYGSNFSITQCNQCKLQLFNFQIYFFIVFPLEEVRKYNLFMKNCLFNGNNGSYNNFTNYYCNDQMIANLNSSVVDIYDCFNYESKINQMTGSNQMYCNNCKFNQNCSMKTILLYGPKVLTLILNRGKGKEFNVKINFYEDLNLTDYIYSKDSGTHYKLTGVITHIGESGMSGHFIAFCKDPISGKWNKFNDAIVTPVNDFKNEVVDFGMPYVLFYEKTDGC